MMKRNRIYIVICLIMLSFIAFLIYANNELDKQVIERDKIIYEMQEREDIIDSLLASVKTDTTSYIYFFRDETGKVINYHQLDSLYNHYKDLYEMLDFIILTAKKNYKFDYSIKQENNKFIIKMWDKKYSKYIEQIQIDDDIIGDLNGK